MHEQVTQTPLSPTSFALVLLPQFTSMAAWGILYGQLMMKKGKKAELGSQMSQLNMWVQTENGLQSHSNLNSVRSQGTWWP